MATQRELDITYMDMATTISKLSHARRLKVGCIMISAEGGIIAEGFNGTPSGFDNECETWEYHEMIPGRFIERERRYEKDLCNSCGCSYEKSPQFRMSPCPATLHTKPEVLHAEENVFKKIMRSTNSSVGSTIYCTHSPCFRCAKMMEAAGVVRVVFKTLYKDKSGISHLKKAGVKVQEYDIYEDSIYRT
jgi:dCMP deaminase